MCGLAGIISTKGPAFISPDILSRMIAVLRHRGPDESGIYLDDRIGLGHARLSVIDLWSGTQPLHNEDRTVWIIFNGEIFNYTELREQLRKDGHRFDTATDTEVIVHLYEQYGPRCLERLNGQFAFAIWDSNKKELLLARDRLGICPLHYCVRNGFLYFASEVKSLLATGEVPRELDPVAIDQIFTFWTTLPAYTAFKNISELEPGCYMSVTDSGISYRKYWEIPLSPREALISAEPEEICENLLELLKDAVKIRLKADVPVGTYLSGGLDSSGITALASKACAKKIQTFGIAFEHSDFDESIYQRQMSSFLSVRHQELMASDREIASHFPDLIWHVEKPVLRTAAVPLLLLSKRVSESHLKVILTGEGADEIFGGYNIFKEALIRRFWSRQPNSCIRSTLLANIYPYIFRNLRSKESMIRFFGQGLDAAGDPLFSHLVRWGSTKKIKTFYTKEFKDEVEGYDAIDEIRCLLPENFGALPPLSKAQYLEMKIFLSGYLLSSQADRVSMANGVETRPPYLDHRVVEYMGRVPPVWKILGLNEKYLLKKVFKSCLPATVIKRSKHPYRAPVVQSLLVDEASSLMGDPLSEDRILAAGYFDAAKIKLLLRKLKSTGNTSEIDAMALAGILSTQLVHRHFIDGFPGKEAVALKPRIFIDGRVEVSKYPN